MKALIFNSGLGKRMGKLTENNPKSMVKLYNGETIFERQIRLLSECGIKEFIITTGPFEEQLIEVSKKYEYLNFIFVPNYKYDKTNYIVSMDNASKYLDDDILMLHGDLVFDKELVLKVLNNPFKSLALINEEKALPEKDFKGKVENGLLKKVAIDIFDDDCYAFQPFYKLDKDTLNVWKEKVHEFVQNGNVNVYAENALNEITYIIKINVISYKDNYIDEIDNLDDYNRVSNDIKYFDYEQQEVIYDSIKVLKKKINNNDRIFVVCGNSSKNNIKMLLDEIGCKYELFTDFTSNPKYEEIINGLDRFKKGDYLNILAIGGGSSIDVAKCIKAFYGLDNTDNFIKNEYVYNNIKLIAIPTTAGTGSESTKFAVMYFNGKKYSVSHEFLLPNLVVLDKNLLFSLSEYQKKSTLMDAFCQAIESYWSKSSNVMSKKYAIKAIELILDNFSKYLSGDVDVYEDIMRAANYSGKAINITTTTLPHAMSYKLTSMYNIAHGQAVGLCLPFVWEFMNNDINNENIRNTFIELSKILKKDNIDDAIVFLKNLYDSFEFPLLDIKQDDIGILAKSVNVERLSNNPVIYDNEQIENIYTMIYSKVKKNN